MFLRKYTAIKLLYTYYSLKQEILDVRGNAFQKIKDRGFKSFPISEVSTPEKLKSKLKHQDKVVSP